ncbi:hypothetical protein NDU88_004973 [Pleurodeles waltl]|uniref:Uncharacterized protein n=1 Tax=Pleurodeles waltl TaxID=8319 RepID=A0AAV7M9P8_PLEWA|nr:hypothetical protein NDU88_004973 [Pleurodeles waltl]
MTSQDVSNSVAYKKERRERRLGVLGCQAQRRDHPQGGGASSAPCTLKAPAHTLAAKGSGLPLCSHLSPNPLGRLLLSGDPLFPTVGLTWSGGYSRLSGSQVALKPTRRPQRQSQHSGSRHLTGAGWRFPPFATGTEPQVQKKVPFPCLGGPSPGEDEVLSAYPGGVVRETLGHRRGGCLLAALRAPDPGAVRVRAGESAPAALPVMQAGRSGSKAGNAGRVLRLPAGGSAGWCRAAPQLRVSPGAVSGRRAAVRGTVPARSRRCCGLRLLSVPPQCSGCLRRLLPVPLVRVRAHCLLFPPPWE